MGNHTTQIKPVTYVIHGYTPVLSGFKQLPNTRMHKMPASARRLHWQRLCPLPSLPHLRPVPHPGWFFFSPKSSDKPTVDLKCKANFLGTESCCPFQSLGRRPRLSRANRNINMILARIQRSAFKNCVPSIHNILPSKSQLC